MFRRLKTLLLCGLGTIAICCGAGFSYWFFANIATREIKSGAEVEDIYENYNVGKPNPLDLYEMLIFPSSYYLSVYDSTNLPELRYGYIERSLNSLGEVEDYYVNADGVKQNDNIVPAAVTEKYCYDIDNVDKTGDTTYKTFKKPKDKNTNPIFDVKPGGFPALSDKYTQPSGQAGWNSYGSVEEDANDKPLNETETSFEDLANPVYQALNVDDRLGYWFELNANEGRFLPIKLSFSGSISPQTFLKLVPNPKADMADSNAWHNYSFSNRVYYNHDMNLKKTYSNPSDAFSNHDKANVFDILLNLETFSTYNSKTGKRTIRLFPTFSNGKDYPADIEWSGSDPGEFNPDYISKGYRDGLKIEYKTKNADGSLNPYTYDSRYFVFEEGNQNVNYNNHNYNIATLNNFNTDNNDLTYIDFAGVYTQYVYHDFWNYFEFKDYGKWSHTEGINFNNQKNKELFQAGDINIYAICVNGKYTGRNAQQNAINDITSLLNEMKIPGYSDSYIGLFGFLKDRSLTAFYNDSGTNIITINCDGEYRAYALFYERILDFKVIKDAPVENVPVIEGNQTYYDETTPKSLIEHYYNVYDTSRNLFLENNMFYFGGREGLNFNPDVSGNTQIPVPLNDTNKFIYKIDGFDLSNAKSLFFGIRMEKAFSESTNRVTYNLNPIQHEGRYLFENTNGKKLGAVEQGKINGDESNLYVNGGEYFEPVTIRGQDLNDPSVKNTFQAFKLKEIEGTSPYSFYSIILVYNPTSDKPFNFDVYAYKQKNLFVKIFDERPKAYTASTPDKNGFLNHDTGNYYYRLYDFNVSMNDKDKYTSSNPDDREPVYIGDAFRKYCWDRHDYKAPTDPNIQPKPNNYKDDDSDGKEVYYCVDHVTRIIIAKATFNKSTSSFDIKVNSGTLLNIKKNHVLYVISDLEYKQDRYNPLTLLNQ